jgi:hypothetical protein
VSLLLAKSFPTAHSPSSRPGQQDLLAGPRDRSGRSPSRKAADVTTP